MLISAKKSLEQINELSRQLLSRILTMQKEIQQNSININESNDDSSIIENELTKLMSKRHTLILCLFEQKTVKEISQELILLNEMVSLDSELSDKSKTCKQSLAEQVIRLKKRKKVTKSYQKF